MGIDVHGLNFLRYAKKKQSFADTITIGRQSLNLPEKLIKKLVGTKQFYKKQVYCEELLCEYFGALTVSSADNSDYEKATHIHNMNEPLPKNLYEKYNTVIDGGCLEHIYNVPQALKNCSHFCKPGGQILHMLPANNFCGHGFYQFSPELFFSLYSKQNGYDETEIFMADLSDNSKWYRVAEPQNGKRINIFSTTELYVLVRTVLKKIDFSHSDVQQSDYIYEWNSVASNLQSHSVQKTGIKQIIKKIKPLYNLLLPLYDSYLRWRSKSRMQLNSRNPNLTVVRLRDVL